MELPFVGPSYHLESRPSGVQRTINMVPVPEEPGNERTAWVFKDVPGLVVFNDPAMNVDPLGDYVVALFQMVGAQGSLPLDTSKYELAYSQQQPSIPLLLSAQPGPFPGGLAALVVGDGSSNECELVSPANIAFNYPSNGLPFVIEGWINYEVFPFNSFNGFAEYQRTLASESTAIGSTTPNILRTRVNGTVPYDGDTVFSSGAWHFVVMQETGSFLDIYLGGALVQHKALVPNNSIGVSNQFVLGANRTGTAGQKYLLGPWRFTLGVTRYSGSTCPVPVDFFPPAHL